VSAPVPIEIRLAGGSTVRGHEFAASGAPVVFIHEPGRDLDAWGAITADFAKRGFRVLALDLPGHGLSDGDADDWDGTIGEVMEQIEVQWGPMGVVAAGAACQPFLAIGTDHGVPIQAMISPTDSDEAALRSSARSMRLVMCGTADGDAQRAAKTMYDGARGHRMMVTGGKLEQGTELLVAHPHLAEELVMWFRRYLTAYHLGWINEITSTAKE